MKDRPMLSVPRGTLNVSFRHLDETKEKFRLSLADRDYFEDVICRLKAITQFTRDQFIALQFTSGKAWRIHRIFWKDLERRVSEDSFNLPVQMAADDNAWQFMTSKKTGRVHGFLVGNTFFIVWLDPCHALYSGKGD